MTRKMETLSKIYNAIKKHTAAALGVLAAILAAIFFSSSRRRDKLVSNAEKHKATADAHESMMDHEIRQAQASNELANGIHAGITKELEDITAPKEPVKPGKTRKTLRIK